MLDFDTNVTMGGRVSRAREAIGLSPAQLGRRLGVMSKTVSNWETDRSEPRFNKLVTLAGVLGVSVLWLATGEKPEDGETVVNYETASLSSKVARLLSLQEQVSALTLEVHNEVNRLQNRIDLEEVQIAELEA